MAVTWVRVRDEVRVRVRAKVRVRFRVRFRVWVRDLHPAVGRRRPQVGLLPHGVAR